MAGALMSRRLYIELSLVVILVALLLVSVTAQAVDTYRVYLVDSYIVDNGSRSFRICVYDDDGWAYCVQLFKHRTCRRSILLEYAE